MASIVRTEKYQRGTFGTFIKWAFIAFNVLMLIWIIGGFHAASTIEVHSNAERAGRAIGSAIGVASLLTLWMVGDVILGILVLFTRGTKVVTEQTIGSASSFASFTSASDNSFSKADELIAQFKCQQHASAREPEYIKSPKSSPSFGRRG
ncbi:hypothetical protein IVB12_08505 [Bradyrhizobium sp. 179]|uniref:hypothetical protein n=1 Tax=Bradyrhizobium sp. 179 TaxID=2782648 RepID=UPI001FF810F7|nr:hypothetical protein [Bradyrhizobium sp. 179]MCK1542009.1 hypothetical protein [Bradyrhizobium sp. 179]